MIVINKTFSLAQYYDFSDIAPLRDLVFFDIETTGLSPASSSVYLIGAVYHEQMDWHIRQWFSDSLSGEQEILADFFNFIQGFKTVVSFNGEAFDIPFLTKCAQAYGLDNQVPFNQLVSYDLYRHLLPVKRLLQLESMKLSGLEDLLGIERSDTHTGAELVKCYEQYLESHDEQLYQELLLHNEEDLKALPQIVPLLSCIRIFKSEWTLAGYSLNHSTGYFTAVIDCSQKVPVSFSISADEYTISVRANQIIIEIQALPGDLKYFIDDYQDYYYLPEEDRAVHKKVGQYVDTDHRRQAAAATCYTHKKGIFLPLRKEDMFDIYKTDYKSKNIYTEYIDDKDFILAYLQNFLSDIC